jgi:hypothetical protein
LRGRANSTPEELSAKNLKWESRLERATSVSGKIVSPRDKSRPDIKLISVKSIGISHDQNETCRPTMEDESVSIDKYGGNPSQGYFAVYDGHGGREVVEYVSEHLHQVFFYI